MLESEQGRSGKVSDRLELDFTESCRTRILCHFQLSWLVQVNA